jgi:alanine dehydrogenase
MPGAVPRTSTFALNNQTADYVIALANSGLKALQNDPGFLKGLNVYHHQITHPGVALAFNLPVSRATL